MLENRRLDIVIHSQKNELLDSTIATGAIFEHSHDYF
jgi:hypothetical protein